MAVSQETIVLNDYSGSATQRRTRTTSNGTSVRYTLSIKSEPILVDFDPLKLGKGPAEAIAALVSKQIRAISETASLSTQLGRKYAANAFAAGQSWAKKRYSGGRTGAKPPGAASSDRLFNDSGRLADGIFASENKKEGNWTINVPANRFDPTTFKGGESAILSMIERLRNLVPALKGDVLSDPATREAIKTATADAIFVMSNVAKANNAKAWRELRNKIAADLLRPILLG